MLKVETGFGGRGLQDQVGPSVGDEGQNASEAAQHNEVLLLSVIEFVLFFILVLYYFCVGFEDEID